MAIGGEQAWGYNKSRSGYASAKTLLWPDDVIDPVDVSDGIARIVHGGC